MKTAKTLFISDLHLQEDHASSLACFYDFIQSLSPDTEALYILGDFFEAYIGDDNETDFYKNIAFVLRSLHQRCHTRIYFMRGNRDFLIGEKFARQCAATLLPDPVMIDLYGTKTLLTHGDRLCSLDKSYQRYRKIIQSRAIKWFLNHMPLSFRQKLAVYLRQKSKKSAQQVSEYKIMDVSPEAVNQFMAEYNVTQLIHGHTHRPAVHLEKTYTRYVLPDWHPKGGMLLAEANKPLQLVVLD